MDTLARYTRFVRGLMERPSPEVVVMCAVARQDIRTVTSSNLALIAKETGLDPVKSSIGKVKEKLRMNVAMVPDRDSWRIHYMAMLLSERGEAHHPHRQSQHQLTISILADRRRRPSTL